MIVILDTHTWIWWVNESNSLSKKAQKHIDVAELLGVRNGVRPLIISFDVSFFK